MASKEEQDIQSKSKHLPLYNKNYRGTQIKITSTLPTATNNNIPDDSAHGSISSHSTSHGHFLGAPSPFETLSGSTSPGRTSANNLGTINGVFLPCIQTILGVILFLRLPSITAQAGCIHTSAIILICATSTLLTALSLSAIATNGTIRAGGPYYVISRTLGAEIGGALGLLFYLGTTIAASMYVLGAVEAFQSTAIRRRISFGHMFTNDTQIFSLLLMFTICVIVSVGIQTVNRTSGIFLCIVVFSISSFLLGALLFASGDFYGQLSYSDNIFLDNIWPNYSPDPVTGLTPTFSGLIALFYPSVTGILAGTNRSAILSDPSTAIPDGTISAIGVTTSLYLFVVWLFGCTIANVTLKRNKMVVAAIAFPSEQIIKIGIIMSCIGAALQCVAGAVQLLYAIAADDHIPYLKCLKPAGSSDISFRRTVWLTWFLASIPTLSGNLDHITPITTMFFLLMYSGINLSCFLLGVLKVPGFRPTFKYFHWFFSLCGFIWCIGLALVINWYSALSAIGLFVALYMYNKKQLSGKDWGDVGNALRYTFVMQQLRALTGTTTRDFHAKNWRPQLLTVVDLDEHGHPTNIHVLSMAAQLNKGRGMNMVVSILKSDLSYTSYKTCTAVEDSRRLLQRHMVKNRMDGFEEVFATSGQRSEAIWSAAIHSGLGPLSANMVMLSWPSNPHYENVGEDYVKTLQGIMNMKKAIVLFKGNNTYPHERNPVRNGFIDIWWVIHDGGLLLLLPYLLLRNHVWKHNTKLRVFAVTTSSTENPDRLFEAVTDHLRKARIDASVTIVDLSHTSISKHMRDIGYVKNMHEVNTNTQHMTVGEVFSDRVYEVPYLPVGHSQIETSNTNGNNTVVDESDDVIEKDSRESMAVEINRILLQHSRLANLVVTNMPLIRPDQPAKDFINYVEVMCGGLGNVILIRGTGAEVITTYA